MIMIFYRLVRPNGPYPSFFADKRDSNLMKFLSFSKFIDSVLNSSKSESAPFFAEKRQKPPQFFFSKKRHNFCLKRHNIRNSSQKMTPHTNFIAFLCDNFFMDSYLFVICDHIFGFFGKIS